MPYVDITMVRNGIHNPANPKHFMRLKPCSRMVRIWRRDTLLVETSKANSLMEIGADIYDPVFDVPAGAVLVKLEQIADKSSHCPFKGLVASTQVKLGSKKSVAEIKNPEKAS